MILAGVSLKQKWRVERPKPLPRGGWGSWWVGWGVSLGFCDAGPRRVNDDTTKAEEATDGR